MDRKPLNQKAYGHIPHLPGSRLTPSDKKCCPGHARIATVKLRDKNDLVIVQEKLDGSCVSVAKINNELIPLSRAGYVANTSPYEQHHKFFDWANKHKKRFDSCLKNGERIVGEWLIQAHGTKYALNHEPFVVFDLMVSHKRKTVDELQHINNDTFIMPHIIHKGQPCNIEYALKKLGKYGFHGSLDRIEGAVWRVERNGSVDFLVKYVRPDKKDGCYLPELNKSKKPVWNSYP